MCISHKIQVLGFTALLLLSPRYGQAECYAILINGGGNEVNNYFMHEAMLRKAYAGLRKNGCKDENIFVLSASGSTTEQDFNLFPTARKEGAAFSYAFNDGKTVKNLGGASRSAIQDAIKE